MFHYPLECIFKRNTFATHINKHNEEVINNKLDSNTNTYYIEILFILCIL